MKTKVTRAGISAAIIATILLVGCGESAKDSADGAQAKTAVDEGPGGIYRAQGTDKISVVSPTTDELRAIKTDYITYTFVGKSGLSLTPLPPAINKPVTVKTAVNTAGFDLIAASEKCEAKLSVSVDGADGKILDPKSAEKLHIDGAAEQTVSVQIMDKNTPNYFCSLIIVPTGQPADSAP